MPVLADQWPLILAGPIIRRVEPGLVSVWIALKEPRAVRLRIWQGVIDAGLDLSQFEGPPPLSQGATRTRRIGERLHLALVVARPDPSLSPGTFYSYNLSFDSVDAPASPDGEPDLEEFIDIEDLKLLGLLKAEPIAGKDNLPLGYQPGFLPGFVTLPGELQNLRLMHGSCRRMGHHSNDGLSWLDDLLEDWHQSPNPDPRIRPQQLFLTGDQIYADDVPFPFLVMLNQVGRELIGLDPDSDLESLARERLPTRYPPITDQAGMQDEADKQIAQAYADLIQELQDPQKAAQREAQARRLNDPCRVLEVQLLRQSGDSPFSRDVNIQKSSNGALNLWPADLLHFPAGLRENLMKCEGRLTSVDLESQLASFGEYAALYLLSWCNACWTVKEKEGQVDLDFQPLDQIFKLPNILTQIWELHLGVSRFPRTAMETKLEEHRQKESTQRKYKAKVANLKKTFKTLSKARRALANIPTYMIFDDHDVTDDWNINQAWKVAVEAAPLGRAILRNGLTAYALFQGWGNTPDRFKGGAGKKLLDQAQALFPAGGPVWPDDGAAASLETLFGLRGGEPGIDWHYTVVGQRHIVLALDTRTRRSFAGRFSPPGLLSAQSLRRQIPANLASSSDPQPSEAQQPLPEGIEILLVISQTPPILPSVTTALVLPAYTRLNDAFNYKELRNMAGTNPDAEVWPLDEAAYEDFLARLAFHRRVVVLSGEVHFGFCAALSYWSKPKEALFSAGSELATSLEDCQVPASLRDAFAAAGHPLPEQPLLSAGRGGDEWLIANPSLKENYLLRQENGQINVFLDLPARIAQFTSSGLMNTAELISSIGTRLGFGFLLSSPLPIERLGWQSDLPEPLNLPADALLPPPVRALLRQTPVVLPNQGWPEGTQMNRLPDFAWRLLMVADARPESKRPSAVRQPLLEEEYDPENKLESYRKIAHRHATRLGKFRHARGVVYNSNLGLVRFEREEDGLIAIQELWSDAPGAGVFSKPFPTAVYRVPLDVHTEARPQLG